MIPSPAGALRARRSAASAALAAAVVLVGFGGLAARPLLLPSAARTPGLVVLLVAVTVASCAVPVVASRAHLSGWVALGIGVGAVSLAAFSAGVPAPFALGAWTIPLAMLAAVGEEAFFRRLLYARLERLGPVLAIGITGIAFALLHVPLYGPAALPVDLAAGLLFGWQRWATGSWAAPAATHAWANLLAMLR